MRMDSLTNIKYLLQKISLVHDKAEVRRSQEESFNVFTTLLPYDDEVYLHSRFISTMLDPECPHKFKDVFLKTFLNVLGSEFEYNLNNLLVKPSSTDWTEYKEIDILLIDRHKGNAVIVENKINAKDSNHADEGQLERYYRRLIDEDHISPKNIEVYYLRPHRNTQPSLDSVSKSGRFPELKEKVRLISYEDEISKWVEICLKESASAPYVRETFSQYLTLIKTMTNESDIQERLDIIETISKSNDTLESAKLLFDNFCHIQWHTIASFLDDMYAELENRGYKVTDKVQLKTIDNIVFGGIQKRKEPITFSFCDKNNIEYTIGSDCDEVLYFGIHPDDNKGKIKSLKQTISAHKESIEDIHFDEDGWIFWCYFDVPSEDEIYLRDFKQTGTFNLVRRENRLNSIKIHLDVFEKVCKILGL